MERSTVDQWSNTPEPNEMATGKRGLEESSIRIETHIESIALPPFFALSPRWKQLPSRMRTLLGRVAHAG
jgi:hypothetical protein